MQFLIAGTKIRHELQLNLRLAPGYSCSFQKLFFSPKILVVVPYMNRTENRFWGLVLWMFCFSFQF